MCGHVLTAWGPCGLVQAATAEALAELEVHNISTAPKFPLSLQRLLGAADDEEDCMVLFQDMKDAVGTLSHLLG